MREILKSALKTAPSKSGANLAEAYSPASSRHSAVSNSNLSPVGPFVNRWLIRSSRRRRDHSRHQRRLGIDERRSLPRRYSRGLPASLRGLVHSLRSRWPKFSMASNAFPVENVAISCLGEAESVFVEDFAGRHSGIRRIFGAHVCSHCDHATLLKAARLTNLDAQIAAIARGSRCDAGHAQYG